VTWSTPLPPSCTTAEPSAAPAPAARRIALLPTARLVATALLVGIVVFAVPAAGPARASAPLTPAAASGAADSYDRAMLHELNRVRGRLHLPRVRIDARMSRSADAHSRAQARQGAIAHGSWNGRVARAAGHPEGVGEVIAWLNRATPQEEIAWVVRGWLDSPVHRPVLLDGDFRRVGIGRALGWLDGVEAAVHTVDWATAR
jgi:uncharacterized protein YkwD